MYYRDKKYTLSIIVEPDENSGELKSFGISVFKNEYGILYKAFSGMAINKDEYPNLLEKETIYPLRYIPPNTDVDINSAITMCFEKKSGDITNYFKKIVEHYLNDSIILVSFKFKSEENLIRQIILDELVNHQNVFHFDSMVIAADSYLNKDPYNLIKINGRFSNSIVYKSIINGNLFFKLNDIFRTTDIKIIDFKLEKNYS